MMQTLRPGAIRTAHVFANAAETRAVISSPEALRSGLGLLIKAVQLMASSAKS